VSDLRSIPVDTRRFYNLMCVSATEARADFTTGEARMDRDTGLPQYLVGILAKIPNDRRAYILDVAVPGDPDGIIEGAPVELHGLAATPWSRDGNSGVSFRADAIIPAKPSTPAASVTGAVSAESGRTAGKGGAS
jgi:hypothetical protein